MARYMGQIATWNAAVVATRNHAPEAYAMLPQNNWIDGLVYQKLEQLDFWPSDLCSDDVFLRRLFLDAIGRLPRPDEVNAFLEDAAPDKRTAWIDYVLSQPEYGNFWANKWGSFASQSLSRWCQGDVLFGFVVARCLPKKFAP